jgi:hypothetical protein
MSNHDDYESLSESLSRVAKTSYKKLKYLGYQMPEQATDKTSEANNSEVLLEVSLSHSLSNRFEKVIGILYTVNNVCILIGTIFMIFIVINDSDINNFIILLVLFGALILHLINILQFGFFSSIVRIRDGIEKMSK